MDDLIAFAEAFGARHTVCDPVVFAKAWLYDRAAGQSPEPEEHEATLASLQIDLATSQRKVEWLDKECRAKHAQMVRMREQTENSRVIVERNKAEGERDKAQAKLGELLLGCETEKAGELYQLLPVRMKKERDAAQAVLADLVKALGPPPGSFSDDKTSGALWRLWQLVGIFQAKNWSTCEKLCRAQIDAIEPKLAAAQALLAGAREQSDDKTPETG